MPRQNNLREQSIKYNNRLQKLREPQALEIKPVDPTTLRLIKGTEARIEELKPEIQRIENGKKSLAQVISDQESLSITYDEIIKLIQKWFRYAFSEDEFIAFCDDHLYDVQAYFVPDMPYPKKIDALVKYLEESSRIGTFLELAEREKPEKYDELNIRLKKLLAQHFVFPSSSSEFEPPFESVRDQTVWIRIYNGAAGPDFFADENIVGYLPLDVSYRGRVHFGIRIVGDSMTGDNILSGDIALIRRQSKVEQGEIAALVIKTTTHDEGTLKRYHIDERKGIQHWFLESSNPEAQHLVVIPSGSNVARIRQIYAREFKTDRVKIYEDAEVIIGGKYIKVLKGETVIPIYSEEVVGGIEGFSDKRLYDTSISSREIKMLVDRIEITNKFLAETTSKLSEADYRYEELKSILQSLPFAGVEILNNFDGFILVEIPNAQRTISSEPKKRGYVLLEGQDYQLEVTLQSGKIPTALRGISDTIRLIDGEDAEYVNFVVRFDCDSLKVQPDEFTVIVPTQDAEPVTKLARIIAKKGEHALFVYIYQKNTLIQVVFVELEIH